MELSVYLRALRRRWPIVVGIPLAALLVALVQLAMWEPTYTTTVRARVIYQDNQPPTNDYEYGGFYTFGASEYNIDDLVEVVRGNVFAQAVADRLASGGVSASAGEVAQAIASDRTHRILTVQVSSSDQTRAVDLARAVAEELELDATAYLGLDALESTALIDIIERPNGAAPNTTRTMLLLALEVLAGIGAGVLIAFLVDYLDDTLRDSETLAATLGVPHLATVPTAPSR
ncbi:MAG TPA: hypothetical protein PKA95_13150 [Thermomicrobiales bacterium]|nr:hypothetical protein [Thermomicrobiales bacterium]